MPVQFQGTKETGHCPLSFVWVSIDGELEEQVPAPGKQFQRGLPIFKPCFLVVEFPGLKFFSISLTFLQPLFFSPLELIKSLPVFLKLLLSDSHSYCLVGFHQMVYYMEFIPNLDRIRK